MSAPGTALRWPAWLFWILLFLVGLALLASESRQQSQATLLRPPAGQPLAPTATPSLTPTFTPTPPPTPTPTPIPPPTL
ncbi:MAG: hypothetical protein MUE67_03330, partial [Anaerolineales bacterium]|nr:hypothetical protein [Anaerolineales bacterium]